MYPLPEPNEAGLGVHATLDLAGQVSNAARARYEGVECSRAQGVLSAEGLTDSGVRSLSILIAPVLSGEERSSVGDATLQAHLIRRCMLFVMPWRQLHHLCYV